MVIGHGLNHVVWNMTRPMQNLYPAGVLKVTVSRDLLLLVFFMNQFPPSPRVSHWDGFKFFQKFAESFASQGLPPVSTTPAANFHRYQRHRREILPPVSRVSLIPVANLPPVSTTPVV
jgi:hypothetical protein